MGEGGRQGEPAPQAQRDRYRAARARHPRREWLHEKAMRNPASPAKLAERLGTAAGVARPVGRGRDPSREEVGTRAQRRNIGDLSTGGHLRRGRRRRS